MAIRSLGAASLLINKSGEGPAHTEQSSPQAEATVVHVGLPDDSVLGSELLCEEMVQLRTNSLSSDDKKKWTLVDHWKFLKLTRIYRRSKKTVHWKALVERLQKNYQEKLTSAELVEVRQFLSKKYSELKRADLLSCWKHEETEKLISLVSQFQESWEAISEEMEGRSPLDCLTHYYLTDVQELQTTRDQRGSPGVKRVATYVKFHRWTRIEEKKLLEAIERRENQFPDGRPDYSRVAQEIGRTWEACKKRRNFLKKEVRK